jgi:hypothetical protein
MFPPQTGSGVAVLTPTVVHVPNQQELLRELRRLGREIGRGPAGSPRLKRSTMEDLQLKALSPRDLRSSALSNLRPLIEQKERSVGSLTSCIAVSRVAFDPEMSQALVFIENRSPMGRGSATSAAVREGSK